MEKDEGVVVLALLSVRVLPLSVRSQGRFRQRKGESWVLHDRDMVVLCDDWYDVDVDYVTIDELVQDWGKLGTYPMTRLVWVYLTMPVSCGVENGLVMAS